MMTVRARLAGMAAAASLLASCDVPPPAPTVTPEARPATLFPAPSEESRALATFYARLQNDLLVRGLMRRDGGGPDTPYDARDLAENFERIALFDEYGGGAGTLSGRQTESTLRRWEQPVRMAVEFGASVRPEQRAADDAFITRYANRISRITGHPITVTDQSPNYHVFVVGEDDRDAFAERLRQIVPNINPASVETFRTLPRSVLCLVFAFTGTGGDQSYQKAVALVRAEHPEQMRQSCIHEEIAQGMGLANDSPRARPSIFNDDEEFGLLTSHDEHLLAMLYDPRLRVGMTADEARPIIRTLAAERLGGPV